MPFLTQGKTNWKYILVVVILAIIVSGGILGWIKRQEVPPLEIKPPSGEEEKFEIIQRVPEDTQSDLVEEDKVVQGPLDKISIVFNREVDKTTLTENHFYVLRGINEKIPGRIEYEKSTKTASLIFDQEIKGGKPGQETRITVIVEGIKDLKGNQIERLVYNIDIAEFIEDETTDWKTYRSEEYGYQIKYPKDWILYKNILGAFDIYKSFYDYNCSVEVYANTERYLYPTEEAEGYFQPFSESKISTEQEPVFIENIFGKKLSSPELGGREIYFFEKEIRDNNYYFNIFLDVYKQDPHGEPIIKENRCKDVFKRILSTFQFLPKEKITDNLITEPLCKYRQGEYEMRFYDVQGRMTGVKDGKIKEEIPGSYYIPRDLTPPVEDCPPNCYEIGIPGYISIHKIEFFCIKEGNYELSASAPAPTWWGELVSFSATNIPIISGLTHVYIFDWELLAKDEEGVVIFIDLDGDGIFEKSITSDNELTCEEFIIQLKKR